MKRKVFINVRLDSTRIPNKPLQEISGIPLFEFAMSKFKDYDLFVDTDPANLLDLIKQKIPWANCYARDPEHATSLNPGTRMFERFLIEHVKNDNEPVAIYHITSPFLLPSTMNECFEALKSPYDSVATVNVVRNFVYRSQLLPDKSLKHIPVNFDPRETPRTQDMEPLFVLNHACFVLTKATFFQHKSKVGMNPKFIETKFPENWDIDYPEDLTLAQLSAQTMTK